MPRWTSNLEEEKNLYIGNNFAFHLFMIPTLYIVTINMIWYIYYEYIATYMQHYCLLMDVKLLYLF